MVGIIEYAKMSEAVYEDNPSVAGWACQQLPTNLGGGLKAAVFSVGSLTVAAFKGTTDAGDVLADIKLGVGINTDLFSEAERYVSRFANVPNLVVTGHSLGGAIAQTVGNRRRIPFVSFNAPGVAILASQNITDINPLAGAVRMAGGVISMLRHPMQGMRDISSAFHDSLGINYRLSGDLVSQIGLHYGPVVSIQGNGGSLEQHSISLVVEVLGNSHVGQVAFP